MFTFLEVKYNILGTLMGTLQTQKVLFLRYRRPRNMHSCKVTQLRFRAYCAAHGVKDK